MRTARLKGQGRSFYHVISRVVDRKKIFAPRDKEVFRKIMRNLEAFMGVRVITYCVMSNHFHLLVEVPDRDELPPLSEEQLLAALPGLLDDTAILGVAQELQRARESSDEKWHGEILARFEKRRGDISFFIKELKQRVTLYMNRKLGRTGTLWEGRYKSLLVEGDELALMTVAAYIDLNPVRAGMVQRPEYYRWSGYAEALSGTRGSKLARAGLGITLSESLRDGEMKTDWRRTHNRYRHFLYEEEQEREVTPEPGDWRWRGFRGPKIEPVAKSKRSMAVPEVLRRRVRYFCDGAVLGSAAFVDRVFAREKEKGLFGPKRETGARKMRGAAWGGLRVLRDLQVDVIGSG